MNDIPKTTIGVDLGGTKHYFCVLDQAGKPLIEGTLPNTKEALTELASKHPGARVAIEVGTHSPWVGEHLAREGCEVYVANARKLRAVYENERKCDLLDARMLAKIARLDPELLSPVTHISQEAMADRIVLGSREFSGTILRDTILRDHNSQGQVRENSQGQILRDRFEDLVRGFHDSRNFVLPPSLTIPRPFLRTAGGSRVSLHRFPTGGSVKVGLRNPGGGSLLRTSPYQPTHQKNEPTQINPPLRHSRRVLFYDRGLRSSRSQRRSPARPSYRSFT